MSSSSTTTAHYSSAIHDMLEAYDMEFEEIGTSVSDCIQQLKKVSLNNDNSSSSSNNDTFETLQRKIKRQFDSLDGTIQNMETQLSTIRLNSNNNNNNNNSNNSNNNDMLKYWKQRINDQHKRRLQSLKTEYQNTLQSILMQDHHHHHHHHTHYDDSEHDYNNNNNNNNNRYRYNSDDSDDSDDDDLLDYHTSNNNKKQKASKETKRLIKNSSETLHHTIQVANHIEQTGINIMGTLVDQRGILERIRGNIDLTNDELHQGGRVLSRMEWRNWIQKSCLILIIVALVVFCLLYLFFKIRSLFQ